MLAEGLGVSYEYRIEGEVFHAHIKDGGLTPPVLEKVAREESSEIVS